MEEQNRLIAEFMGIRSDDGKTSHESSEYYYEDCELEYHTSWDWLMPVVEKIEGLHYTVNISASMMYINGDNGIIVKPINIDKELGLNKLDAVYRACVEFIKWYNETKN